MPSTNPFEAMLDQLKQLLTYIEEHMHVAVDKITIPPDIDKRLKKLQKRVEAFNRLSEDIVNLSGVSQEELKIRLKGSSEELPPQGKAMIARGDELRRHIEGIKEQVQSKLKNAQIIAEKEAEIAEPKEPSRKLSDKEKVQKRRDKFKRFGSDNKWKPL